MHDILQCEGCIWKWHHLQLLLLPAGNACCRSIWWASLPHSVVHLITGAMPAGDWHGLELTPDEGPINMRGPQVRPRGKTYICVIASVQGNRLHK